MRKSQRGHFLVVAGFLLAAMLHLPAVVRPVAAQDTAARISKSHMAAAAQVARHLGLGNLLEMMAAAQNMQGLRREVFLAVGRQRADLKDITANKMPDLIAPVLAEEFTQAELETILAFLLSDTGRKWTLLQAPMMQKVAAAMQKSPEVAGALFVAACASAIVTNAIVRTEEMMRSVGQIPLITGAALEGSKPLQDRAETSCNCVLDRIIGRFGPADWIQAMQRPENQGALAQAAKMCPDPLAGR